MGNSAGKLRKMLLDALQSLHGKSTLPYEEQWFTRSDISKYLGASNGLNPVRVNALEELVDQNELEKRQKPNDARDYPQYRISK
jgi:hypothetical protein